ncbi:MAG TPA: penicillin-binding protein 2 [Acetobacteraceae bacterium]|nr:penicillin-binding protein 2 [Acetobacteraceae bacterium]
MKREAKRGPVFTRRALIIGGVQVAAFGALATRLYRMQVEQHDRYATLAQQNSISERLIAPERGLITDRFGTILAGNKQHWRALFMLSEARDPHAVLARFASLIALSDDEMARINHDLAGRPRYIPVMLKDYLDWDDMARIEVNAPDLPGVIVDVGSSRLYPFAPNLAHTIGYVARPSQTEAAADPLLALPGMRVGRSGVERAQDEALRGSPGVSQTEMNVHGQVVRVLNSDPGVAGDTVQLSLDMGMQQLAGQRLQGQIGSAIVLDATNGEILAMASEPSFDPALFDKGVPETQWKAWMGDKQHPLTDRSTSGLYAPGSTFKPTVALAALDCGAITGATIFNCPGYFKLGNHTFYCDLRTGHGDMNVVSAIQQSCDVFFYRTALAAGIEHIAAMAKRLGIGTDLGVDLPGVLPGQVPDREWARKRHITWVQGNTVVQGIGQGYTTVTPISLATMAARIATGVAVGPHITRRIAGVMQQGAVAAEYPSLGLDERHLALVRQGMFEAVNTQAGTAYAARLTLPGVAMAGKTGTAQVHNDTAAEEVANFNFANVPYDERPNALFVCFAPIEAPRYAAAIIVEHGIWGAQSAAPIAHDLMTYALTRDPAGRDTPIGPRLSEAGLAPVLP